MEGHGDHDDSQPARLTRASGHDRRHRVAGRAPAPAQIGRLSGGNIAAHLLDAIAARTAEDPRVPQHRHHTDQGGNDERSSGRR